MCAIVLAPIPLLGALSRQHGWPGVALQRRVVREKGHVRSRGQSRGPQWVQSLGQPYAFMTAWQLFLWNEACVLWCVSPVRQVKLWNPVWFIGNSHKGWKGRTDSALHVLLPYILYIYLSRASECLNGLLEMSPMGWQMDQWIKFLYKTKSLQPC